MFLDGVAIGHAGEVIADGAVPAVLSGAFAGLFADFLVMCEEVIEQFLKHPDGPHIRLMDHGIIVKILVEIISQFEVQFVAPVAVLNQWPRLEPDFIR